MGGRGSASASVSGSGIKTRDESLFKLQQSGFKTNEKYSEINDEVLSAISDMAAEISSRYGVLYGGQGGIKTDKMSPATMGQTTMGFTWVNLNGDIFKDPDKLVSKELDMTEPRDKWGGMSFSMLSADADRKSILAFTFAHEFGHVIQGRMKYDEVAWKKSNGQYAQGVKKEIMSIARKKYGNGPGANEGVSGYGRTETTEFFAETFAGMMTGYKNPVTMAMRDWLDAKASEKRNKA